MAKADAHLRGDPSDGSARIDAGALVFCNVSAVAQAVIRSLGLSEARQSSIDCLTIPSRDLWPGRQLDLAIVINSDVPTIVSAVRAIKRRWKGIRVLVVGLRNAQAAIMSCVEAGADGLFMADESLEQLPAAVQDLLSGKFRPPPNLLKIWAGESKGGGRTMRASDRRQSANVFPLAAGGKGRAAASNEFKHSARIDTPAVRPFGRKLDGR